MGRHWSGVDVGSFFHAEELPFHSLIDVECMPCHLGLELRLELAVGWGGKEGGWEEIVGETKWRHQEICLSPASRWHSFQGLELERGK